MCVFSNSVSQYDTTEKLFTRVSYDAHECLGHLTGQLRKKEIIDSKMKLFNIYSTQITRASLMSTYLLPLRK